MNKKQVLEDALPLPGPTTTVFGAHVDIEGDVFIDGDVMLIGRISGSLRCKRFVLDREGELEGTLVADSAAIWGNVSAEMYAPVIELHAGCAVEGAAYHEEFILDREAYFEGRSRRYSNPQAMAPAA
ncbi:MAG: polymer-forming cytoskeletal protein [Alphaproteobacteria bacterium]|nr:polymer-forming cytoskeletal protein [Alphaproteobacteria bacterium]